MTLETVIKYSSFICVLAVEICLMHILPEAHTGWGRHFVHIYLSTQHSAWFILNFIFLVYILIYILIYIL